MKFTKHHQLGSAENMYGISEENDVTKAYDDLAGESGDTGFRHSRYYHNYFRGYTEVRTEDEKGKYHMQRIYTAPYRQADVEPMVRLWYLSAYVCLTVIAWICYVKGLTDPAVPGNAKLLVAVPSGLTIIPLILMLVYTVIYLFRKKKMTLYEWKNSSEGLMNSALAVGIGEGVTALAALIAMFVYDGTPVKNALTGAGLLLLGAVCGFAVYYLEKKMPYKDIEHKEKLPEGEIHEIW